MPGATVGRRGRWQPLAGRSPCTRRITLFGNPVLHRRAEPVSHFDRSLCHLVDSMFATMYATPGGVGLAAPQIGIGLQVFVFDCGGDDIGYVINPRLSALHGETQEGSEGCLSIPGIRLETPRYDRAEVRGLDVDGAEVEVSGSGLVGRCLQHETDHLAGRLFVDTHASATRQAAQREIRAAPWFGDASFDPEGPGPG
ncbi:MAG TPA: peptide deformylase [Acidimicrobiales bacterium]